MQNIRKVLRTTGKLSVYLLICLYANLAYATTYYVDSLGGSDSNTGTSSSTPWQTIAKVNAQTFHPGDSILFRAGDIWREQLNISNSGANAAPITFSSYGTGAPPIISGASLVTSWAGAPAATSSWISESTGFNRNDPNGFTYAITNNGKTVATGSVTWANMRLSIVSGHAFADFSAPGTLTPYVGDQLIVTDSGGRSLVGDIKGAGTAESYGGELLSNPSLTTSTSLGSYETTPSIVSSGGASGDAYLQSLLKDAYGWINQTFSLTSGMLVRNSVYLRAGTETNWCWFFLSNSNYVNLTAPNYSTCPSTWTQAVVYGTADSTGSGFMQQYMGSRAGFSSDFNMATAQQVLTPSATGVTIESSNLSANVYYAPYSTVPSQVFEDGAPLAQNTISYASLTPGQWYLDTTRNYIWVFTTAGDDPSGHTMEASQRTFAMNVSGANYITVQNLQFEAANSACAIFQDSSTNFMFAGNTVKFCSPSSGWRGGVVANQGASNGRITANTVTQSYNGIVIGYGATGATNGVEVDHNSISYSGNEGIGVGNGASNVTVCYNAISFSNQTNDDSAGIEVYEAGTGNVLCYNLSTNGGTGTTRSAAFMVDIGSGPTQVYGNIGAFNSNGCLNVLSNGSFFYNNTCYHNENHAVDPYGGELSLYAAQDVTAENNIFVAASGANVLAADSRSTVGNVFNHNDYLGGTADPFYWSGASYDFEGYRATTSQDANSINVDPRFENAPSSQFWLQSTSPAIGAGANLGASYDLELDSTSTWPNSVVLDNENSSGNFWEIGAYVYKAARP
jgi:hypothetical protein